jgi:hypothetical protein
MRPFGPAPSANRITLLRDVDGDGKADLSVPPVGMAWEPATNMLWAAVNERDELGNDLVPDYMTSVRDGGFYGWPYSYCGQHVDERVTPARSRSCGQGDRARLRAGIAHGVAGPCALHVEPAADGHAGRHVRRPARVVEP